MRRNWITTIAAAALAAATLPAVTAGASAMPAAQPLPLAGPAPDVTLTSGGCGPYRHRGFNGFCYPGGGFGGPGIYRPYGYRPYGYRYGYRRFGYY